MRKLFLVLGLSSFYFANAQDDLLNMLDVTEDTNVPVSSTFSTTKLVNAQTTETLKKGALDFRMSHRFGNLATTGAASTLWGLDQAQDIRFTFDYGLTKDITIGFSRNKQSELLEGYGKWTFLRQKVNNKIPLSIAAYTCAGFNPGLKSGIYQGSIVAKEKTAHRFSYFSQLIIARKFNKLFSLELLPSMSWRNFIINNINPNNQAYDNNMLFSCGVGGKLNFTRRLAITIDYFYTASKFRTTSNGFYAPLAIGLEVNTGGHVFNINLTNCSQITETLFVPSTQQNWLKGQFKLGFTISRVFNLKKHK